MRRIGFGLFSDGSQHLKKRLKRSWGAYAGYQRAMLYSLVISLSFCFSTIEAIPRRAIA